MDLKMIKYLYLDDAEDSVRQSFVTRLSKDGIEIITLHIAELDLADTEKIQGLLQEFDGLLLDLRLDEMAKDGKKSPFTATEYAQHIRTMVTNGAISKDLPIVLFSTDEKLQKVYSVDLTSQDLFDRYIEKTNIPNDASKKLFALAKGYQKINELKGNFEGLLGIENLFDIDERIFSRFTLNPAVIPVHEYAQTILKDLVYVSGALINENMLAARLGIDISSSDDWEYIKSIFESAKYVGIFSDGWERWWMYQVDNIFVSISNTYLSYMDAEERVTTLKEKYSVSKLIAAKPIGENHSTRFWTICKAYNDPLDPLEGFRIYTPVEPKPWQEYEYCSLLAFLEKMDEKNKFFVHPSDKEKLELKLSEY